MKKIFSHNLFKAILATILVIAMCALQYENGISDYKFWISSIVILGVMIYLLILISGLVKKIERLENQNEDLTE